MSDIRCHAHSSHGSNKSLSLQLGVYNHQARHCIWSVSQTLRPAQGGSGKYAFAFFTLTPSLPHSLTPSSPHPLPAPHPLTPSPPLSPSPPHSLIPSLPHPLTPSLAPQIPVQRKESHIVPECGTLECEAVGTCELHPLPIRLSPSHPPSLHLFQMYSGLITSAGLGPRKCSTMRRCSLPIPLSLSTPWVQSMRLPTPLSLSTP